VPLTLPKCHSHVVRLARCHSQVARMRFSVAACFIEDIRMLAACLDAMEAVGTIRFQYLNPLLDVRPGGAICATKVHLKWELEDDISSFSRRMKHWPHAFLRIQSYLDGLSQSILRRVARCARRLTKPPVCLLPL